MTIDKVAAAAGVSIRTVSRVINNSPKVGERTRVAVLHAIEELGFRPNGRARALASGRSSLIGVIQGDPNIHVIGLFQAGIVERCASEGFELVVHSCDFDSVDLISDIETFIQRSRVDGLVMLPPLSERCDLASLVLSHDIPAVSICAVRKAGYPVMLVSKEREISERVGDYLVELGHERIALIGGPEHFVSSKERETGFRASLERNNVEFPAQYLVRGDYGFGSGWLAMKSLMTLREPPTAVFATNDKMAAGAIKFAIEHGVQVPHDVSVVGFDDSEFAAMLTPSLTTVQRPTRDMGFRAAGLLLDLISSKGRTSGDLAMELALVVRDSSGPPPPGAARRDIRPSVEAVAGHHGSVPR